MVGAIRAIGRCPVCDKPFQLISPKLGYVCMNHDFAKPPRPCRYMFDFWHGEGKSRQRERLYRDQHGNILESYTMAIRLQEAVTTDINAGTFRIEKYRGKEPSEYYLVNRYDAWMGNYDNPNTLSEKNLAKNNIIKHFGSSRDIRTISTLDVDAFSDSIVFAGPKSRRKQVRALVQFLEFCRKKDCPSINVSLPQSFLDFEAKIMGKGKKKKKNIPTLEEAWLIINKLDPIDRIACLTIGAHARRPGEMMVMQAKNFSFEKGIFIVEKHITRGKMLPGTKTGEDEVPCNIHKDLVEILRELCAKSKPDDYVFSTDPSKPGNWRRLSDKIRKVTRRFGLKANPYQVVKHAFLSHVSRQTKSLETGRALAQHSSDAMERNHYCDMTGFDLDAQRAAQEHLDIPATVIPTKQDLLRNR
jgi:hypothetical protein